MSGKPRVPEVNTALNILKGAVVQVLGTPLTISVEGHKSNEGRLAVQYDLPAAPNAADLARIFALANEKIREDVPVSVTTMDRAEAEAKYEKEPVNSTFLYDRLKPPATVTELSVLLIEGWNVNACLGSHVESTGKVRPLVLKNVNFRPQKKELQFVFTFEAAQGAKAAPSAAVKASGKTTKSAAAPGVAAPTASAGTEVRSVDEVEKARTSILKAVLAGLKSVDATKYGELTTEQLSERCAADVDVALSSLKNASYTRGLAATKDVARGPRT